MAMEVNQTVLLVDMDLRYPKISWYFDMEVTAGLQDYINSDKPLSEILINPGISRLVVLPGKGQITDSSEMISTPKMRDLIEELKSRYQSRIVIFDLPPILGSDDVLASMDYYDAVLLVVEEGVNKPDEVKKALQLLSEKNLLGTVLNKSENPPSYQGYY
jgi:Mrp family chromosome partitioning ATPase